LISQGVPQPGASNNGDMAKTSLQFIHTRLTRLAGVSEAILYNKYYGALEPTWWWSPALSKVKLPPTEQHLCTCLSSATAAVSLLSCV